MSVDLRFVVRRTIGVLILLLVVPALAGGVIAVCVGLGFGYAAGIVAASEVAVFLLSFAAFGLLSVLVWAFKS